MITLTFESRKHVFSGPVSSTMISWQVLRLSRSKSYHEREEGERQTDRISKATVGNQNTTNDLKWEEHSLSPEDPTTKKRWNVREKGLFINQRLKHTPKNRTELEGQVNERRRCIPCFWSFNTSHLFLMKMMMMISCLSLLIYNVILYSWWSMISLAQVFGQEKNPKAYSRFPDETTNLYYSSNGSKSKKRRTLISL